MDIITINDESLFPIDGRELHRNLGIKTSYTVWFERMCEYGFEAEKDFQTDSKNVIRADGSQMPQMQVDHKLSINAAKEICMLQRNDAGKQIRQQLIAIEEQWNRPEAVMARALKMADRTIQSLNDNVRLLSQQIEADAPKVAFAESFIRADTDILIREMAKHLTDHGFPTGQNKLYQQLRNEGYLIKSGQDRNLPSQRSMNNGWMTIKTTTRSSADSTKIDRTTLITPKGQEHLLKHFCGKRYGLTVSDN